ncbi:hypothetical protein ACWG5P_16845 [Streptomyces prasinus]
MTKWACHSACRTAATYSEWHQKRISSRLIHLSLAEIGPLITPLTDHRPAPVEHLLHWSTWRRRHSP